MLKSISLGYNNFIANILWIQTVNYYGEQQEHVDYNILSNKLHSIIALNPYAEHAYYIAASILPWGTKSTTLSQPIIQQAMQHLPNDWRWPYYYGFNAYWFEQDTKTAVHYLSLAAAINGAPAIIASIALRMQAEHGDIDTALIFLERLIHEKQDVRMRNQLIAQRKVLLTEKSLRTVDQWLNALKQRSNNQNDLQQLRAKGYPIPTILPDGGHLHINNNGEVVSSIAKKRFKPFVSPNLQRQRQ
ncbi:MAG: hypothetical protein JKY87_08105 [Mariprofundus sp.]|nr:hypothetical protein [Mariprofundus sp.]